MDTFAPMSTTRVTGVPASKSSHVWNIVSNFHSQWRSVLHVHQLCNAGPLSWL